MDDHYRSGYIGLGAQSSSYMHPSIVSSYRRGTCTSPDKTLMSSSEEAVPFVRGSAN